MSADSALEPDSRAASPPVDDDFIPWGPEPDSSDAEMDKEIERLSESAFKRAPQKKRARAKRENGCWFRKFFSREEMERIMEKQTKFSQYLSLV